jgi:hypothetical protein
MSAGAVGRILVLQVHTGGPGADQLDGQGESLGRPPEASLHVHECRRSLENLLPFSVVEVGIPRALDPHPHLVHQLHHVVRGIDPDIGEHALRGGELPSAPIQRLEAKPGHDRRGEGVVRSGGVNKGLPGSCLVEQAPQLVGRLFCLRWGKKLLQRLCGVNRLGGNGASRGGHQRVSLGRCSGSL